MYQFIIKIKEVFIEFIKFKIILAFLTSSSSTSMKSSVKHNKNFSLSLKNQNITTCTCTVQPIYPVNSLWGKVRFRKCINFRSKKDKKLMLRCNKNLNTVFSVTIYPFLNFDGQ